MADPIDRDEIAAHQFTEPLKPPAKPPSALKQMVKAAVSGHVWWRVGWATTALVASLESAEKEMQLRGELDGELTIYQLQGNASASAGTHSKPGAADLGQTSDAQIATLRRNGFDGQRRTPAQGFSLHCHGFAQGDTYGSPALMYQRRAWNNGRNGLVSNGPVEGLWPTKYWKTAVAERGRIIMGLLDDYARKAAAETAARLLPAINAIPARTVNEVGINISADPKKKNFWSLGHILSWVPRSVANKDQVAALDGEVTSLKAEIVALKTLVNGLVNKK